MPPNPNPNRERKRKHIRAREVAELLDRIGHHRAQLNACRETLREWLDISTDLSEAWAKFTAQGGIDGDDFAAFMKGALKRRPGALRQRRHLRIISSREPVIRRRIRRRITPNDAA